MGGTAGIGTGHTDANDFVQTLQNPFGKTMSGIFDPIAAEQTAGTLTYDQATAALDSFNEQWAAFDAGAQQYKAQGGEFATVVDQAYNPNQAFMQTVNNVRTSLTNWQAALKPASTSSSTNKPTRPPTATSILKPLGLTPAGAAQGAVAQQAKDAARAPGFSSTLLGGAGMKSTTTTPALSMKTLKDKKVTATPPTLLGY